jgi:hypothetical protein
MKHIKLDKSPKAILQPQTTNKPAKVQSKLIFTPIKSTNTFDNFFKLKTTSFDLSLRDHESMSTSPDKSVDQIDYLKQIGISLEKNFNIKRTTTKVVMSTNKPKST